MTWIEPECSDFYNPTARSQFIRSFQWPQILQNLGLSAKTRSSGAMMMLCVFHQEKTPSLCLWPSGRFLCHGCGAEGDMVDFVAQYAMKNVVSTEAARSLGEFFQHLPCIPNPNQLEIQFPKNQ